MRTTFSVICFMFLLPGSFIFSQNNAAERKISVEAIQQPLKEILRDIEQKGNVIISYSGSLINADSLLSVKFQNRELKYILSVLLKPGISFKINNNDVILFAAQVRTKDLIAGRNNKTKSEPMRDRDTIIVFRTDTLIKIKVDTIFVKVIDTVYKPQIIRETLKEVKKSNNNKIFYGIYYQSDWYKMYYDHFGLEISDHELKDSISSNEAPSYSFRTGLTAGIILKQFQLSAGVGFRNVRDKFYFEKAFDDFLAVDTNKSNYNSIKYITIPLNIGWTKSFGQNFETVTEIGLSLDFLISSTGNIIDISKPPCVLKNINHTLLNKCVMEACAGVVCRYKIAGNFWLYAGPSIFYAFSSEYSRNYTVAKKRYSLSILTGLQMRI